MTYASNGYASEADRWAEVVDRLQQGPEPPADDSPAGAWSVLSQAVLCRNGVARMRADADEAGRRCSAAGIVAPVSCVLQGVARIMDGDLDDADSRLAEAVTLAQQVGAHEVGAVALSERAIVAMARRDWHRAEQFADQSRETLAGAGIEDSYIAPLVCAVAARVAVHRGDLAAAQRELTTAQRLRHVLTYALPHAAAQSRIQLALARAALADTAGARTLMREVDEVLVRRPRLGTLVDDAHELRDRLAKETDSSTPGASTLTAAELRVLPLLATHLSFHEIADELFLSTHTIKSHALSIYRKLGASTRSQAVARARELALLDSVFSPSGG
jgi:LuxR family maltose regulon positive regulatory protein